MSDIDFVHAEFEATTWEQSLKKYIDNLSLRENELWYKNSYDKKVDEELSTLGYYIKYRYGSNKKVSFKLNPEQTKLNPDGWVYVDKKPLESVQIAIAWRQKEEADFDKRLLRGEEPTRCGYVGDKIDELKKRCLDRITIKSNPSKKYEEIDVLLIGVRDYFARRIKTEYSQNLDAFIQSIENTVRSTCFREVVIVDTNYVGNGDILVIPNHSIEAVATTPVD